MIIKNYSKYDPNSKKFGLTPSKAFDLELECYKRLSSYDNFPILIDFDKTNLEIILEDCGIHLMSYFKSKKRSLKRNENFKKIDINISLINFQIEKIIEALSNNNIVHLDVYKPGKNLCFKNNRIYLIDFDVAVLDHAPLSTEIDVLYQDFLHSGGYDSMLKKFKNDLLLFLD
jgi:tRNA A-37 threonylcarbamoyl transferase component Bud32